MTNAEPWAKIDITNLVVSVEIADNEWVESWRKDNPDSAFDYVPGHHELYGKWAAIGWTYDPETTWFIPPSPGPSWVFDRNMWEWVDDTP